MKKLGLVAVAALLVLSGCTKDEGELDESTQVNSKIHVVKRDENVWWIWDEENANPTRFISRTCRKEDRPVLNAMIGDDDGAEVLVICGEKGESVSGSSSSSGEPSLGPPVTP